MEFHNGEQLTIEGKSINISYSKKMVCRAVSGGRI